MILLNVSKKSFELVDYKKLIIIHNEQNFSRISCGELSRNRTNDSQESDAVDA